MGLEGEYEGFGAKRESDRAKGIRDGKMGRHAQKLMRVEMHGG